MKIDSKFTSVYHQDWEINFLQCYPNGVLKYTDLCHIFQLSAGNHADLGGLSYTAMQKKNQAWVLTNMRIEIDRLPKWRDVVTVKTWIVDMNGYKSTRALALYHEDKIIASALTEWVVMDTQTRKSTNLSLDFSHFKLYPTEKSIQGDLKRIEVLENRILLTSYQTKMSDLDIVGHVNNVKYLEWCLDYISSEIILKQKISSIDMNFIRELHLEDQVTMEASLFDHCLLFSLYKNQKNSFTTEITLKS
jgi:acyl-ACP thioesterase